MKNVNTQVQEVQWTPKQDTNKTTKQQNKTFKAYKNQSQFNKEKILKEPKGKGHDTKESLVSQGLHNKQTQLWSRTTEICFTVREVRSLRCRHWKAMFSSEGWKGGSVPGLLIAGSSMACRSLTLVVIDWFWCDWSLKSGSVPTPFCFCFVFNF
jgi:hypothetical protein